MERWKVEETSMLEMDEKRYGIANETIGGGLCCGAGRFPSVAGEA